MAFSFNIDRKWTGNQLFPHMDFEKNWLKFNLKIYRHLDPRLLKWNVVYLTGWAYTYRLLYKIGLYKFTGTHTLHIVSINRTLLINLNLKDSLSMGNRLVNNRFYCILYTVYNTTAQQYMLQLAKGWVFLEKKDVFKLNHCRNKK